MPERIQLRRTKGWRKPEGAVVVARPTKWGNPHTVTRAARCWEIVTDVERELHMIRFTEIEARELAVELYRQDMQRAPRHVWIAIGPELTGRDLACWCPLNQPCHADVLLELANRTGGTGA